MTICTNCNGKGVIDNHTALGIPCKCWRCQGTGALTLKDIRRGDHCIHLYKNPEEQIETIVSFVTEGLERREYCICLIGRSKIETVKQALKNAGVDHEKDKVKQSLSVVPAEDFYFPNQAFEPERVYRSWARLVTDTAKSYPHGFRAVGELPALVRERVPEVEVVLYEALVHDHFETNKPPFLALCQYHIRSFSNETLYGLAQSHHITISV